MLNVIQIPQMAQRAQKRWQQLGPLLIFSRFQDAFRDIIRQLSNSELDEDGVDSIIFRLEQLSVHLVRLCNVDLMTTVTQKTTQKSISIAFCVSSIRHDSSLSKYRKQKQLPPWKY